jgi:hypothetical protein
MGQKDTGLVPKGWHFGLQFLVTEGMPGWLVVGKEARELFNRGRTVAMNKWKNSDLKGIKIDECSETKRKTQSDGKGEIQWNK